MSAVLILTRFPPLHRKLITFYDGWPTGILGRGYWYASTHYSAPILVGSALQSAYGDRFGITPNLVGRVGFEPTHSEENGFTVRRTSPSVPSTQNSRAVFYPWGAQPSVVLVPYFDTYLSVVVSYPVLPSKQAQPSHVRRVWVMSPYLHSWVRSHHTTKLNRFSTPPQSLHKPLLPSYALNELVRTVALAPQSL